MASSTLHGDHQAASFLPRREQSPNPLPFPAQGHVLLCLGQAGLPEVGGMSGSELVRRAVRDFGTLRIPSE